MGLPKPGELAESMNRRSFLSGAAALGAGALACASLDANDAEAALNAREQIKKWEKENNGIAALLNIGNDSPYSGDSLKNSIQTALNQRNIKNFIAIENSSTPGNSIIFRVSGDPLPEMPIEKAKELFPVVVALYESNKEELAANAPSSDQS